MPPPQLNKTYEPQEVEKRWGQYWIDEGLFTPKTDGPEQSYTVVIPPPNVTGSLHIGHALNSTLQDILIRWKRMQGYKTLWLPGTDHAGIATQNVVERQLMAEGSSREQIGRQAFIKRVWSWKQQSGDTIIAQLKQLGASCDWSRQRFTLDEGLSQAVHEVFVSLHEEGLIYRGERLINWCPRCLTALSDIEVEHENIKGKLHHIHYPVAGMPDTFLTIATTRPETMLGDTAVAVHPEDPRYNHLMGQSIQLPLTNRTIPIVGDSILVDREFGTGAVKITPACDFNDEEAGKRLNLPSKPIFDHHARLNTELFEHDDIDPQLKDRIQGKGELEARKLIVEALEERELLQKIEDHTMALGKCYRCKTVILPYPSPQWFVKIQPLADPAIKAVESGDIRIIPDSWKGNYFGWMRNVKDWCISRQIWWGHQIPAWYCKACNIDHLHFPEQDQENQTKNPSKLDTSTMTGFIAPEATPIISRTPPTSCPHCGGHELLQDPDVLDTWFSSALWPFSTLGWPKEHNDLKTFYPTATLVTGLDILFFWVARMIMMGLKFTNEVPFHDVYIHALVRDAEGQKMSKSKGNVINPLTKMQEYGTDALRFTLASMASPGRDIKLAEGRIEGYRNFVTKIWNAARFIALYGDGELKALPTSQRSFADRWILSRLNHAIRDCTKFLEEYRFDQATSTLYQFLWHEYCDWYIELVKPALQDPNCELAQATRHTLYESFEVIQRLLHPFMPFLSEELWQAFPHSGTSIVTQQFPTVEKDWDSPKIEKDFQIFEQFVNASRTSRALLNCSPVQSMAFWGTSTDSEELLTLNELKSNLEHLTRGTVAITDTDTWATQDILRIVTGSITVGSTIDQEIDLQRALDRIRKQVLEKEKESSRLQARLSSKNFTDKAEPDVIRESQTRLKALTDELALLASSHTQLSSILG
ncbi:MAG: valine--tRNA ligase [Nitrospirales bacterium]|nr:MAG: valine--tRNA ligase [Nitrospirales bacterium]